MSTKLKSIGDGAAISVSCWCSMRPSQGRLAASVFQAWASACVAAPSSGWHSRLKSAHRCRYRRFRAGTWSCNVSVLLLLGESFSSTYVSGYQRSSNNKRIPSFGLGSCRSTSTGWYGRLKSTDRCRYGRFRVHRCSCHFRVLLLLGDGCPSFGLGWYGYERSPPLSEGVPETRKATGVLM